MKVDKLAMWVVTTFALFIVMLCGVFYLNGQQILPNQVVLAQPLPKQQPHVDTPSTSGCSRLIYGSSSIEIHYPKPFVDISIYDSTNEGSIMIATSSKSRPFFYVMAYPGKLDDAINGRDDPAPGRNPKYSTSTFNGYPAALHKFTNEEAGELFDDYVVSSTRELGFNVQYRYGSLTPNERTLAENIIQSALITSTSKEVNFAQLQRCGESKKSD